MSASCEQLSPFIDEELSAPEMDAFREHLDCCGECSLNLRADWLLEQRVRRLYRHQRIEGRLVGLLLTLGFTAFVVGMVLASGGLP